MLILIQRFALFIKKHIKELHSQQIRNLQGIRDKEL